MTEKRHRFKLPPTHIAKLINKIGINKAAKEIGSTPSALKKSIRLGRAEKSKEVAARFIYAQLQAPDSAPESERPILIVRGSNELIDTVVKLAKITDGEVTRLN